MRITFKVYAVILTALSCVVAGCSSKSDDTDDESDTTTTTTTVTSNGGDSSTTSTSSTTTSGDASTLPIVTLTIPTQEEDTALRLTATESKTVLERTADRANAVIEQINAVIARLNVVKLPKSGAFHGKAGFSGALGELSDDPDYDRSAVVCLNDAPFIHIMYKADGSKVRFTRDFSVRADLTESGKSLVARIVYDGSGANKNLDILTNGVPFAKPAVVTDGDYLADHVALSSDADGKVSVSMVEDWRASADAAIATGGDTYMVGRLDAAGDGEFVAYRTFDTAACPDEFDETANDAPGWCLGRTVGSNTRFSADERAAAWERLQDIAITSADSLEAVTMDSELACPAAE